MVRYRNTRQVWIAEAAALLLLQACAGDFVPGTRLASKAASGSSGNAFAEQEQFAKSTMATKVQFHYKDFYSLTAPKADTSCAGDAKAFYDPLQLTGTDSSGYSPAPFPQNVADPTSTLRPAFLKNVAVDLTDANSPAVTNLAYTCSYGLSATVAPPSSCASFDYGALGGVSTTLGGSLLLVGGIQGPNYAGFLPDSLQNMFPFHGPSVSCGPVRPPNLLVPPIGYGQCGTSTYALAVNALPASIATDPPSSMAPGLRGASEPISSWSNLGGAQDYSGPAGVAGAGAAYDVSTQRAVIFGGAAPLTGAGSTGPGVATYDTWVYQLNQQKWTSTRGNNMFVDPSLTRMDDFDGSITRQLAKAIGGRALFGYVASQGMALNRMSTNGAISGSVDFTDRIVIAGGLSSIGTLSDVHRFNPTYGPDWVDTQARSGVPSPGGSELTQWLDSYHTQLLSNAMGSSLYKPDLPPISPVSPNFAYSFGLVSLRDNVTSGAGFLLGAGGFDSGLLVNTPSGTCTDLARCGSMMLGYKRNGAAGSLASANFIGIPNLPAATQLTPLIWGKYTEGANLVPWYGGTSMVNGFDMQRNELVYFGGASCSRYLTDSTATCSFGNPGAYWRMNPSPAVPPAAVPAAIPTAKPGPAKAGMAVARGLDGNSNVIVVAWGGMSAAATADNSNRIHYLWNNGGTPTWENVVVAGVNPPGMGNSVLVFSHVTRKYYLFGGYAPVNNYTSADTWELSVSGACAGSGTCTFAWRQLNVSNALTCYPNCPPARRSHRIVEVNYYHRSPGGSAISNGESVCSATAPCSFGIFMEGGTPDGVKYHADRWMFDPTANGGAGHWQLMPEVPPRVLAAMSSVSYFAPASNTTVHRAIIFGGETGLHSSVIAAENNQFVPPTLGDTYMYDFDSNTVQRVELLGKGYNGAPPLPPALTQYEYRQGYNATDPSADGRRLAENSPPPLAGAVMVTRTMSSPVLGASSPVAPLKIPEVYLFGGRTKDGSYHSLSSVYKFCAGSTGETPPGTPGSSAGCDAFDPVNNPSSPSPRTAFVGRWLKKTPSVAGLAPDLPASFLGAGAYDSYRDKIVMVGGRSYQNNPGTAVTDRNDVTAQTLVFEYDPPTRVYGEAATPDQLNGVWSAIPHCAGSAAPAGRYGHTLNFDPLNHHLIMTGGYDLSGTALLQTISYHDGRVYETPEVWTATRIDTIAPCYQWKKVSTFGNSLDIASQSPPQTGIAHAASIFIPSQGYNTGYYSMFDKACDRQGPISSTDPTINKLLAGGAYFDLDRSALGPNENLLLNLTYIPMGESNQGPDSKPLGPTESAVFKIHLMKTGSTGDALRLVLQPRHKTYAAEDEYPAVARTIAVLAPPTGQIREDQILIPISIDPSIDRIRIERYSGTGILIDASLYRMGYR